jgi:RPA family protein
VLSGSQVMTPVTNREFEYRENQNKKEIFIIRPEYLTTMQDEIASLFKYDTKYKIDSAGVRFSEEV